MIDWERVNELKDEVGDEDFAEIVALFLEEASDAVQRLLVANDPKSLESELHFLKGSALNLGFSELAIACLAAESAVRSNPSGIDTSRIAALYAASHLAFQTGPASAAA